MSERLGLLCAEMPTYGALETAAGAAAAHLVDGLGIMVSGASTSIGEVARRYLQAAGRNVPEGRTQGLALLPDRETGQAVPIEDEAFLWGAYAFSENYGDTSLRSVAHPNTVIVPALLAAAREKPVGGRRFLEGLVVGYQVMEFLARSLNNGVPRMAHQIRGFRPTATCGPAGAAAAIAHLWDLDAALTQRAVELACNYGGGLRRHGTGVESSIRIHSGEAARRGVTAVLLAMSGLEGERHLVEGEGGFFSAYRTGELDASAQLYLPPDGGGAPPERWAVEDVAFKLHCTPHTLATALDCILDILKGNAPVEHVRAVEVAVPAQHVTISASEPYRPPSNATEAAGSYPFCCGAVLATGDFVWPTTLVQYLHDQRVLQIAAKTRVVTDAAQNATFEGSSGTWPAAVTIVTEGGSLRAERSEPFGASFDKGVADQVERKFRHLTEPVLAGDTIDAIVSTIGDLQDVEDVYRALRRAIGGA